MEESSYHVSVILMLVSAGKVLAELVIFQAIMTDRDNLMKELWRMSSSVAPFTYGALYRLHSVIVMNGIIYCSPQKDLF